ncbi:MAG: GTP cyclohydrolase I [Myxococcales bacterium]|nr:GTP cyclohydrolase I [Myxococcales bacterium]
MDKAAAERAIADFLRALGRDPRLEPELAETPKRVAEAFADELLTGYATDLSALLADGSPTAKSSPGIVVVRHIAVATVCPHHLLSSLGHATVAYRPGKRVLGLGTIARLVDACARRLALQEQIGEQVVSSLVELGGARGAFCQITLRHSCLSARGSRQADATVRTQASAGDLADPASARELDLALRAELSP